MAFPSFHLLSLLDEVESYGNPLGLKTVECAGKAGDPVVFEMRSLTASHSDFHKARSSPEAWRHFMTLSYNWKEVYYGSKFDGLAGQRFLRATIVPGSTDMGIIRQGMALSDASREALKLLYGLDPFANKASWINNMNVCKMLTRSESLGDIPSQTDPKYINLFMDWSNRLAFTEESHIQLQEAAVKHLEEGYALRREKLEGAYFTSVQAYHHSDDLGGFFKQLEVEVNQKNLWKHDLLTHKHFQHLYGRLVISYNSTLVAPDLMSPSPVYSEGGIAMFEEFKKNHRILESNAVYHDSLHRAWVLQNHNFVFDKLDIVEKGNLPAILKGYSTTQFIIGAAEAAEVVDAAEFASLWALVGDDAGAADADAAEAAPMDVV